MKSFMLLAAPFTLLIVVVALWGVIGGIAAHRARERELAAYKERAPAACWSVVDHEERELAAYRELVPAACWSVVDYEQWGGEEYTCDICPTKQGYSKFCHRSSP